MTDGRRIALFRAYQSAVVNAAREHGTEVDPDDFLKTLNNLPEQVREDLLESFRLQTEAIQDDQGAPSDDAHPGPAGT